MPFTQFFIWVEGPDDERFVDTVLRPELAGHYDWVEVVTYAGMTKAKITKWIESLRAMEGTTYAFLIDNDESPCVLGRKGELLRKVKSLQISSIVVVIEEIEAWYLAGLTAQGREQLDIEAFDNTDDVNKERFDRHRGETYKSRVEWMIEMLRSYSLEEGVLRNSSLRYFATKFLHR
jgi:hypothetical protein